jgi:hypothetical protein
MRGNGARHGPNPLCVGRGGRRWRHQRHSVLLRLMASVATWVRFAATNRRSGRRVANKGARLLPRRPLPDADEAPTTTQGWRLCWLPFCPAHRHTDRQRRSQFPATATRDAGRHGRSLAQPADRARAMWPAFQISDFLEPAHDEKDVGFVSPNVHFPRMGISNRQERFVRSRVRLLKARCSLRWKSGPANSRSSRKHSGRVGRR